MENKPKTGMEMLNEIKSELTGLKAEVKVLNKEISKSGFESNYLAILFSLLGISLPVFLFKQQLISSNLPSNLIFVAIFLFTPFIFISLFFWFLAGKSIGMRWASLLIFASAVSFIVLFILSMILDTYTHILSSYPNYFATFFYVVLLIIVLVLSYKIGNHLNRLYS